MEAILTNLDSKWYSWQESDIIDHMKKKILQYDAIFEKEEDGGYSVWIPDLPGCASQGNNLEEAIVNIKEAVELYLEDANNDEIEEGRIHKDRFIIPVQVNG